MANAKKKEYILCAAIYISDGKTRVHQPKNIKDGLVISGSRHCSCMIIANEIFPKGNFILMIEGFLTSKNRFVNRKVASDIAFEAKQTRIKNKELFSEDLY